MGEKQEVHHDITFLLVLADGGGHSQTGGMVFWPYGWTLVKPGSTLWRKQLGNRPSRCPLDPIGPMPWCRLSKDTCHVPLPKEGHLVILPQGGADMTICRRISLLEVCQLLISGLQVAYPVGLNGCKNPIIISLPESLANGISLTGGGSMYLEINIPQPMVKELDWKASPLGRCCAIILSSPLKTTPPKLEREVSMAMEVRSLLS